MTDDDTSPELILLPVLKAYRDLAGRLFLTQKYLDGVAEFESLWPGRVTSLIEISDLPNTEMDLVEIDLKASRPALEVRPKYRTALGQRLRSAEIILAHLAPEEAETAELCHQMGVPIVFVSEYTPQTERQIVNAGTSNPLLRARRKLWLQWAERTRQHMLRAYASGLQCSGTPTYDHYRDLVSDVHLFFDNRVRANQVISEAALDAKCAYILTGRPLRLAFGGRLVAMKGVMDLPHVARHLTNLGVPFTLDIVGGGPLEEALRAEIAKMEYDHVRMYPPMEFKTGWVPFLQRQVDLFICCHPQGDPSSTYPEVMSCGVPIVGYGNEAWEGVLRVSGAGWSVPMHDTAALASKVAELSALRTSIVEMSHSSRNFASDYCFEQTEIGRVKHLAQLAGFDIKTIQK